ncbi:proline dehydrogenase family protein [Halobacterium sp. KA-6]|uniref:proline dehydrogenase family protein n=1 Tax=Halobacterium sp. KA-6 TaxID=2896368 RepID=UPI001E554B71|nr:proline dehydrogenase family protein [Halobacterium sp. KA-6]MCD2205117.1 proline dehydrogenase family protein [Halobacterium sp. KA-6]
MLPPIANQFVAGTTASGTLDYVSDCNSDGMGAIVNLLGEHYDDPERAAADTDTYCQLVSELAAHDIDGCISVKPSQIGIDISPDVFESNFTRIVETGANHDVFVWCDMEDHTTTDTTLEAVEAAAQDNPHGVGIAIQANLKRTDEDLQRLVDVPAAVRLVKGAYDEPTTIAYESKAAVNEAYKRHLEFLFREFDQGIAVGSHDPEMLETATDLHEEYGTPFEIQMLMGVREDAQRELASEGYEVNQYVPYGDKWIQYFYRRVRERKENALFALRAIIGI